jgi:glycosyltransferase involved in cell wall biosynthesis
MSDKKIAFFLSSLAGGGAERVCLNLAEGFIQHGFKVDLVLARSIGVLFEEVSVGVRIVELHTSRVSSALFPLADYLRREQPIALISAPDHTNLIAIWAKMMAGVSTPVLITAHNYLSIVVHQTPKIQEKLYPYLLRLFQGHAAHIVAVSAGVADDLARTAHIPRDRISVIYNPAVRPELDGLASQPLVHPWFADGQPPVILAAGRLVPQKDYPTLLQAFALLRARRQVRLVILGEGKQRAELGAISDELGIATDVDFPGFDLNPYRYMARCSVFVLSSAWEGFSVVLAEALACGAQVVSTDCLSGPGEILDHGKYGRLVPVGDAKALAVEIENSLIHPMPASLMRGHAREFTADVAVKNYLRLLKLE